MKKPLTEAQIERLHSENVRKLKTKLGNVPLADTAIRKECTRFKDFLGVFMQNSRVPENKDGCFIMNNDTIGNPGIHWIAGIIKGKNIYLYDSFGRYSQNLVPIFTQTMVARGYKIHNADLSDQDQYGNKSVDCGHRSISALSIAKNHGITAFMKL